jgi:hypothetical protein
MEVPGVGGLTQTAAGIKVILPINARDKLNAVVPGGALADPKDTFAGGPVTVPLPIKILHPPPDTVVVGRLGDTKV